MGGVGFAPWKRNGKYSRSEQNRRRGVSVGQHIAVGQRRPNSSAKQRGPRSNLVLLSPAPSLPCISAAIYIPLSSPLLPLLPLSPSPCRLLSSASPGCWGGPGPRGSGSPPRAQRCRRPRSARAPCSTTARKGVGLSEARRREHERKDTDTVCVSSPLDHTGRAPADSDLRLQQAKVLRQQRVRHLCGPGRRYGTAVSGWPRQLVSRIGVPDHAHMSSQRAVSDGRGRQPQRMGSIVAAARQPRGAGCTCGWAGMAGARVGGRGHTPVEFQRFPHDCRAPL